MSSAYAHSHTDRVIRQLCRRRMQIVQRRRRQRILGTAAAFALALGSAIGLASFTGTDLAGAAAARASSLLDLLDKRSPGERSEGQLTKTKHRELPARLASTTVPAPVDLTESLVAPPPSILPVDVEAPPLQSLFFPPPPPGVLLPPPGGPPGPPGGLPGGPPGRPPENPPPVPPVPEPGTWMTMLLGFAAIGCTLRRRKFAGSPSVGNADAAEGLFAP